ncbi:hypothetical protein LAZ67_9002322 [Cordylochernes scorpioides]|uniref:Uncharacterized protein n=1 Tax=Cordylochernes scorpioides TaxID=51811 RepID=A0ABY6KU78_9ARAC|nr:hypothetical protein LAZ67_9002322 [Cordylochernes scorpioides]
MVPCTSSSLTPKTVDQSKLRWEEEQRKIAQKTAFDRRHAATKKAELIAGEKVWHCEYANLREELIRDRIVLGVKDRKLEKELMLNENLILAKAVEIARQWEAVMREQQGLNPSTSQVDTTRKVAKQKPKASGHGNDNGGSTSRQTDSAEETDEGKNFPTCFNCGTTKHHVFFRWQTAI